MGLVKCLHEAYLNRDEQKCMLLQVRKPGNEGRERGPMVTVKPPAEIEEPRRFLTELPLSHRDKFGGRRHTGATHAG